MTPKLPVSLITGFLGSGKTTLLKFLLGHPAMAETAVIVNELGEIGLDHQLLEVSEGDVIVMQSGCLCCTVRSDLGKTLSDLYERRQRGSPSPYRRVLIETTGLADPAPILHTLMQDPLVVQQHALDAVVTTVDGLFGLDQLDEHPESAKQAAVADRLLITKADVASREDLIHLRQRLASLNPAAPVVEIEHGEVEPATLFSGGLYDLTSKGTDAQQWISAEAYSDQISGHHDHGRHDMRVQAHCLIFERPLNWRYFSPNLARLVSRHAEKLLRVKGILNVEGEAEPVVVHGVQHQFQRMRLKYWPDEDRRSKLVLITRGLERESILDWLQDERLV